MRSRVILSVIILMAMTVGCLAQKKVMTERELPAKYKEIYREIGSEITREHYEFATKLLMKLEKKIPEFINIYTEYGRMYFLKGENAKIHTAKNEYKLAADYLKKAVEMDSVATKKYYNFMIYSYIKQHKYDTAKHYAKMLLRQKNVFFNHKEKAEQYLKDCNFALDAIANPVPFNPVNMGPAINSPNREYLPAITADEEVLIFTRNTNGNEDFFVTRMVDSIWSPSKNMGAPINTPKQEGAQTISPDGRYFFFTGCNRNDGINRSCDIYYTKKVGGYWTKPSNIGTPINTERWESQPTVSSDGRIMIFASNRKGSIGKSDLWITYQKKDQTWTMPKNMGNTINTTKNEESPYLHPDGQTLYFSSNGHTGMGDEDIYMTRKDSTGKWGEPINLGYPINTSDHEGSLIVSANGKHAYFASDRKDSYGWLDLYTFDLDKKLQPQPVTYVKGIIRNFDTELPVEAVIELIDLQTGDIMVRTSSDKKYGNYLVCLTTGREYALNVSRNGFLFHSENFSLKNHPGDKPYHIDVKLKPIMKGQKVVMNNIFFEFDSYKLKHKSKIELKHLVAFMNDYPGLKIQINGHTDDIGEHEYNQKLSEDRAKAVYKYLINNDIDVNRLKYVGFGPDDPLVPNTTEEGRARNRRTEFEILSK